MHSEDDTQPPNRQLPSLVSLCQRVAIANAERLCGLGDDVRFDLVKPILQNCSAETLLRLEEASPQIMSETHQLWHDLCFRAYPLLAKRTYEVDEPESWRDAYFVLQDLETKRLEDIGTRLRTQREEAELRKKESSIKITDRVPPQKRIRPWGQSQPKTLFQKTRSDAAKMQKGIYNSSSRKIPARTIRPVATSFSPTLDPAPTASSSSISGTQSGSRVTVSTVTVKRPANPPPKPQLSLSSQQTRPPPMSGPLSSPTRSIPDQNTAKGGTSSVSQAAVSEPPNPNSRRAPAVKPPLNKKDPMAALFMPKHRAYSQLPTSAGLKSRP
ncbi:hypothetical protein K474DRAFT_1652078 [Panus rudis PR-1116 ss-1]|nr:hypothetical protein K474DRAFT_1652078 [Panus rudis PR-1116 ss-1]